MKKSILAAVLVGAFAAPVFAEGEAHFVAIHVDQNDPQVMNMALNNAQNVANYYESQGDEVTIELVAYGPGLQMFVAETSPVADRISSMSMALDNLSFSACGNTHSGMQARSGTDVPLLEEVSITPSGVVRLIELQEIGYAYVRP